MNLFSQIVVDAPADRRRRDRLIRDALQDCPDARVVAAMSVIARHAFVGEGCRGIAYEDRPIAIGGGATISQPSLVARMLAHLKLEPGQRVLDVGAGSGWATALLAHLVGPNGQVVAVERLGDLVAAAAPRLVVFPQVSLMHGDGLTAEGGPFDAIHVACACAEIPWDLVARLAPGGRLIAPVGQADGAQRLWLKDPSGERWLEDVLFVPALAGLG